MLTQTQDSEEIIERVAALDIGKAEVMCCVRVPDEARPGKRLQEVTPYNTGGPVVAAAGGSAGRAGREAGGDGIHLGLLEACVLPVGGPRV